MDAHNSDDIGYTLIPAALIATLWYASCWSKKARAFFAAR